MATFLCNPLMYSKKGDEPETETVPAITVLPVASATVNSLLSMLSPPFRAVAPATVEAPDRLAAPGTPSEPAMVLDCLEKSDRLKFKRSICRCAARDRHVAVLQWARARGYTWNEKNVL